MTKFFIDLHGCAKNQVDAEIISTHLINAGYEIAESADDADLIIVNSCGFIQSAKEESINAVIEARQFYKDKKILLAGCLAERYAGVDVREDGNSNPNRQFEENRNSKPNRQFVREGYAYLHKRAGGMSLANSLPEADGIFGNGDLSKIVDVANRVMNGERVVEKYAQLGVSCAERKKFYNFKKSAYVKITEGCSNHCSFCAIPIIRGELRSRPIAEIVAEIKSLVADGCYEINLIGQDLAAYGTGNEDDVFGNGAAYLNVQFGGGIETEDGNSNPNVADGVDAVSPKGASPLCVLLKNISAISGNFIVRLLYIHPDHFNADILDVIKSDNRFLHYFDIPFQTGSDKLILSMNRKGSFASYTKMISGMKSVLPDLVLRTTFMTGFPGEKKSDFEKTLEFMKTIRPAWSGCFCYSLEDDTPAYNFRHRVSPRKAKKRAAVLEETQEEITAETLKRYVGKVYDVLIEEIIPPSPVSDEQDDSNQNGQTGVRNANSPAATSQIAFSDTEMQSGNVASTEGLAIGRAWFQAPEVDGAVVVRYETDEMTLREGDVVKVKILAVSGVDLDGVALLSN